MGEIKPKPLGVLTDEDIAAEAANGILISGQFDSSSVQQACYELRAGNTYYDLSDQEKRIALAPSENILLKPHQLIVIISREELNLPGDVVGRILMKGKLFSLGLQPINTYADPGFCGRLGIVMYNSSPNYIKLEQGSSIAKIEFERLSKPVARPYTGQHGYQTEIWPIPKHFVLTKDEVAADRRIGTPSQELRRAFGDELASVVDRVFRYERVLLLSAIAYTFLSVTIIVATQATDRQFSVIFAFLLGLVTNIVSAVILLIGTSLRRGKS